MLCFVVVGQNKTEFEKNGTIVNFQTTKLGEIVKNEIELIKDMNVSGVFVFLPDKKSIVIRHQNGNDELLKVKSKKVTPDNNYVFDCDKNRVLFISPTSRIITYSIAGNSALFLFPINIEDIEALKSAIKKY
jgi:hypothetical protein